MMRWLFNKKNYKILSNNEYPQFPNVPIKITRGKFKGMVYGYLGVRMDENDITPEGKLKLNFTYTIIKNPKSKVELDDNDELIQLMGDILVNIMETDNMTEKYGIMNVEHNTD